MAQSSWPWDGVTDGDAALLAPYDEQEWDDNERMLFGAGGNCGVLANPYGLNHLEVTERGAGANMSVDVDTGAALVYGKRYKNTAVVNLTIAANASGNPRIDRVVAVWNRQAVAYTGVTPNISPKTCRLAVLQGTPAASPTAPALTQTAATVYMIPLAQVAVANGAASILSADITDEREAVMGPASVMLIERQALAVADSEVYFDVPQLYRNLRIVAQARSTGGASSSTVEIQFNGDTGNSYDYVQHYAYDGGISTQEGIAQASIYGPWITGAGGAANYADAFEIEVPSYRGQTFYKSAMFRGTLADAVTAGLLAAVSGSGFWRSTDPIVSITLSCANFAAGSVFSLYGLL